jgi:spoIIIJ-associated protein
MDKLNIIKTNTEDLLKKIVDTYQVDVVEDEGMFHINIKTEEEAPTVIGRHGETIRALQKILEVVLYKQTGENVDVLVNVNDYREKQKERLQHIASEVAGKAQANRGPSYLRGFSSYERRIIHEYITKNYPDLTTYSVGEGRDRKLVIDVKDGQDMSHTE